uniref:Ovule protein n=1 Tax=Ascaris lumbricoides TaxID=6252 RepID=A0A0M3II84_ASCLU
MKSLLGHFDNQHFHGCFPISHHSYWIVLKWTPVVANRRYVQVQLPLSSFQIPYQLVPTVLYPPNYLFV